MWISLKYTYQLIGYISIPLSVSDLIVSSPAVHILWL